MNKRSRFVLCALLPAAFTFFTASVVRADDLKKAQELYDQARLRDKQGDVRGAIDDLTRAIGENPRFAEALRLRAALYFNLKEYEASIADSNRAIEINGTQPLYFAERCDTYRLMGRLDAALADCNKALELSNRYAYAYSLRSRVRHAKGDTAGAAEDARMARQIDPARYGGGATQAAGASPTPMRTSGAVSTQVAAAEVRDIKNVKRLYEGEPRSRTAVSLIVGEYPIVLRRVDDTEGPRPMFVGAHQFNHGSGGEFALEVLPGEHRLTVAYVYDNGSGASQSSASDVSVTFTALAGHEYKVSDEVIRIKNASKWHVIITDVTVNRVVLRD